MSRSLALLILSLCAAAPLCAAEKPATAAPLGDPVSAPAKEGAAAPAKKEAPPTITLKNRSSFKMETTSRNPFWPIGWKPAVRLSDPNDHGAEIPTTAFLVSSIAVQEGQHFAIINGKVMAEGQQFGLQMRGQVYQIAVKKIEDGRVILSRRDEEIIVPLRRK